MKKFEQDGKIWWEFEESEADIKAELDKFGLQSDLMNSLVDKSYEAVLKLKLENYTLPDNFFSLMVETQYDFCIKARNIWQKVARLIEQEPDTRLSYSHWVGRVTLDKAEV